MGISPAVLLRWQPERSEVSLSLFVVMADREPLYFIADSLPLISLRITLNCSTNKKVPPQFIQLSMNKSGGTTLYCILFDEDNQKFPTNNLY